MPWSDKACWEFPPDWQEVGKDCKLCRTASVLQSGTTHQMETMETSYVSYTSLNRTALTGTYTQTERAQSYGANCCLMSARGDMVGTAHMPCFPSPPAASP